MTEPSDANTGEAEAPQEATLPPAAAARLRGSATAGTAGT
jgi:hypothetical protein